MMIQVFLAFLSIANVKPAQSCETYAPRLDGTIVTVCNGSVAKVCDAAGTCHLSSEGR